MLQVTETGVTIDSLESVHKRLVDGFKRIYGKDINLSPDSPDGQMIALFSQEIDNVNQAISTIVQMLDPYKATGPWLEQRAMYSGITRRGADYSYIDDVIFNGSPNVKIPKNSVLIDENRVKWVTIFDIQLDSHGSAKTQLRSQELGAFTLLADKELKMETVTLGVDKITTTKPANQGVHEENDSCLLTRFMRSHSINNRGDRKGIEAALLDLNDVKQAKVYENISEVTDENGVPRKSMNAVVIGGADDDIGLVILRKKDGGCGVFGEIESLQMYRGVLRTVKFDRAKMVDIKVSLKIKRVGSFHDIDTESIKSALAATEFEIGEDVYATRLTCQVNQTQGFYIKSINVNGGEMVEIGVRGCAQIKPEDVEVEIE